MPRSKATWSLEHLSEVERKSIARELFTPTEDTGEWLNGPCPNPAHDDSNPSFGYNYKDDQYKCHARCMENGDLIDLFGVVHGLSAAAAFVEFKDRFGKGEPGKTDKGKGKGKAKERPQGPTSKAQASEVLAIPEDVWARMQPLPEAWAQRLEQSRGWSGEILRRMDVRMLTARPELSGNPKKWTGQVEAVTKPDRLAIPVRDDAGRLVNIRCYKPGAKARKIFSWAKGYGAARLFPAGKDILPDGVVLLCEGEPDMLCALSRGFNAVTQTSKTAAWSEEHLDPFRGRDVVIAYDADQAGQEHAAHAVENLLPVAASLRRIDWPDYMGRQASGDWPKDHGQDLTDFFVKHGKTGTDLNELIAALPVIQPMDEEQFQSFWQFFEAGASGRVSFKPRLLADQLVKDVPMLSDPGTGQLYIWNGRFYEPYDRQQVQSLAMRYLGKESTTNRINDAASQAVILSTIPHGRRINDREDWVCVKNGMLNLQTLELLPHAKEYLATFELAVEYAPQNGKRPDRWLRFMDETIETPEAIMQLQEFMGYSLTRDARYGKALLCLGPGSDGKSKVLQIMRAMVGPANSSAVSMRDLEDQFQRAALYEKLLNVSAEINTSAMDSEYFKKICTGDAIQAAFKHKDSFEFIPYVKLAFAANKLPRVLDNSDGFFRRVLPIGFKNQFGPEFGKPADTDLDRKLLAELSQIFEWALVGLHRLRAQGHFTEAEETRGIIRDYRRLNNPVQCFVEDDCEVGEGNEFTTPKDDLYKRYKEYCRANGYGPLSKENFLRELRTVQGNVKEYRPRQAGGKRPRLVYGLRLKPFSVDPK